ncbi:LLM class flavin-dependent oxidoreductase [Saccharothrix violaceirubra]|uniref:Alkanesulfonate monooxygenase SsuD/methylene tetrahydromethanopterin reductase-like flavin-dependent oxidoreductase (Luciferase family) n=1 Tax=Saccharothrix violaceirubra TaxID=413306 RepID=A0A7W7WTQ8_9PSEU|nr:LLM class flavin-dependent oxidoreductase [Saccharothrix violaceirubra]MBB4963379.1 alkanesulfonate monooxygenase SsuD/methylene tetrahydromethanopterin reductase-like flavin-dependent oxidoreductase (luciferase family) [Saccharothrix violaceirubra]
MSPIRLAVALDGAGWHPAAWRLPEARPDELFTAPYWIDQVQAAERGGIDFVTIEDQFGVQSPLTGPDGRTDRVIGRLDALLVAAHVAPHTRHVGLVPTANATHTDPAAIAAAFAALDQVSGGRSGWRPQLSARENDAAHFGRRPAVALTAEDVAGGPLAISLRLRPLFEEAAGFLEAVRGAHDTLVAPLAHAPIPYELAAKGADIVFVTPFSLDDVGHVLGEVREAEAKVRTRSEPLRVYADLLVHLDDTPGAADLRRRHLDGLDGAEADSDAKIVTGTPGELADLLVAWHSAGIAGFRLRPASVPHDLHAIVDGLVPELRRRGVVPEAYGSGSLRERVLSTGD